MEGETNRGGPRVTHSQSVPTLCQGSLISGDRRLYLMKR